MQIPFAMIGEGTAIGWSVAGALFSYVLLFILPELLRQHHEEEETGIPYKATRRTKPLLITISG